MASNLLVVIPSIRRGGAERTVALMSREWARENAVTVAVFDADEQAFPLAESVRLVDLDCAAARTTVGKMRNLIFRVRRLSALIRELRPDRIFSFMEAANFPTILACVICKRLQSLTVSVRNNPVRFPVYYRMLIRILYRLPGRIVAVSDGVRGSLVGTFGLTAQTCVAIPNPIDAEAVRDAADQQVEGGLPASPFVLAAGRMVPQKGFDLLIEAFAKSAARSDHVLLILGDGPEKPSLRRKTRDLGIEDKVLLPGNVASPPPYMRAARCFVLSSRYEGWPNVVMEAMACECPVVAFDCPFGPSEIIENGTSGILVRTLDIDALSSALDEVTVDAHKRAALGHAGKLRVTAFDNPSIARRWIETPHTGGSV